MKARYQFRFYPTDQQQASLAQLFGCVRVVWNDALAVCKQSEKLPSNNDLQKLVITQAKKTQQRAWLCDVSNIPLQQSVADLGVAYKNFFDSLNGKRKGKKVGAPRFKKKTNQQSARFRIGGFSIKGKRVYLAKIGEVSPIWSREIPSAPSSVTVIKDCTNRYFLSFVVQVEPIQVDAKNQSVGIDLGIKTFAVISNGEVAQNPDYSRLDRKIRNLQKKLARQLKDSKRRHRTRIRIAKLHNRIADTRKDFLRMPLPRVSKTILQCLWYVIDGSTRVKAGTLDDTTRLRPVGNLWTRSAQTWVTISDQMLKYLSQFTRVQHLWKGDEYVRA